MNNVMVHLTRLDNRSSAMVVEIEAVFFDPKTGVIGAEFHEVISPEKQDRLGTATAAFNSQWGHYLRTNYPDDEGLGTDIDFALGSFAEWLCQIEPMSARIIWSTGNDFSDAGILHQLLLDYIGNSDHITGRYWYSSSTMELSTISKVVFSNLDELTFNAVHAADIVKLKANFASDMMQSLNL
ncbi:hypothetical protein LCGC14_3105100 [marine sediment metagenome]|uniref:3'-5' exoribonuclease Rv2179c-like domain-containing protein n=1 Tax=marine sediment metagenome TaxID=412755 RepID=A0A0F8YE60_9ZZZZ